MKIVLLLLIVSLAGLYLLSWKKYREFIEPLDEKRYPLKKFLPTGLYLLELFKCKYSTRYDRKLLTRIIEISGLRYSQYYLKIHWANKISYLLLGLVLISFIGAAGGLSMGYAVFSISLMGGLLYVTDHELTERIRKRRLAIQLDFPDFLNKLILLINAGLTVPRAWEKIVTESRKDTLLYAELGRVLSDIRSGKPEQRSYEEFAKRCKCPEITRFISIILQNMRKGSTELVSILRVNANECWEMRKNSARRLGEEACTRMLLPMMIMFAAILLIVATPAILALRNF